MSQIKLPSLFAHSGMVQPITLGVKALVCPFLGGQLPDRAHLGHLCLFAPTCQIGQVEQALVCKDWHPPTFVTMITGSNHFSDLPLSPLQHTASDPNQAGEGIVAASSMHGIAFHSGAGNPSICYLVFFQFHRDFVPSPFF